MPTTTAIPRTNVNAQQTITLPATTAEWTSAEITIERNGTGGANPWLNQLTQADTLLVNFQYSLDGGQSWVAFGDNRLNGGSVLVKGQQVPTENTLGIGIGRPFPVGTQFRVTLTPSTPVTFSGSATYQ